ncbi:MAG: hypothetical protein FJW35_16960, partial [Acidobacteria bacterium]|nr:hypothetical protein [Acidobacteriota bacterium]
MEIAAPGGRNGEAGMRLREYRAGALSDGDGPPGTPAGVRDESLHAPAEVVTRLRMENELQPSRQVLQSIGKHHVFLIHRWKPVRNAKAQQRWYLYCRLPSMQEWRYTLAWPVRAAGTSCLLEQTTRGRARRALFARRDCLTASVRKGPAAIGVWLLALFALTPSFGSQDHHRPLIREIRIAGLRHTRESVVREQLVCEVGRPYDPTTVQKDIERLDRLGVFSSIEIQPVTVTDGIVLEIRVSETIPYLVYPSFDANDENGLSAGLGVMTLNLFGRAVAVSGKARFGNGTTLSLDLTSPWRTRMPWWYRFEFHQRFRPNSLDDFEETASEIDL